MTETDALIIWALALIIDEQSEQRDALDRLERKANRLLKLEKQEMADLTAITDEVTQNSDAVASAVALLTTLAEEIRNLPADQGAIDALAAQLDAQTQALADAVVANTPAAPTA